MHMNNVYTTTTSLNSIYPGINRWAIGFDPLFQTLGQISQAKDTYPPYNVRKDGETYILEMAVAGFAKDELSVTVKEQTLSVRGSKEDSEADYLHQGISARDFYRDFALAEYVSVKSAKIVDGLLTIVLLQELPEEKKEKIITIK